MTEVTVHGVVYSALHDDRLTEAVCDALELYMRRKAKAVAIKDNEMQFVSGVSQPHITPEVVEALLIRQEREE